jgi:isopentenyl-diphosphate delta-isomerase
MKLENQVVLVDSNDNEVGRMEKLEAHQKGLLHRAFSVLLFNQNGDFLIQKRAVNKYHSGGLWSNSCCSHPFPDEDIEIAGKRRLLEEINIDTEVKKIFKFEYRAELDNDLVEHEMDHVMIGHTEKIGPVNLDEASEMKFISLEDLKRDMNQNPDSYTSWFKILIFEHLEKIQMHWLQTLV